MHISLSLKPLRAKIAAASWKEPSVFLGLLAITAGLLWYRLGTLLPGYSVGEQSIASMSRSGLYIWHHPVEAPYTVLVYLLTKITHNPLLMTRVASAIIGFVTVILFYVLVRHWHGRRTAAWGTFLFIFSAWFLHVARLGAPEVMQFGLLALIASYTWLQRTKSAWAVLVSFALCGVLLYVPGMIWFIVLGVMWQLKTIDAAFKKNLWAVSVGGLILLAIVAPLGLAMHNVPSYGKLLIGLPQQGWPAWMDVLKRLAEVPEHLFFKNTVDPEHWLGHVAIFDFFTTAMIFLGGYLYVRHIKLGRVQLSIFIIIVGAVLSSLGGGVTLSTIVPILYIVAASGIGFMIDRWLVVFPRNIIAKSTGYALIGLALATVCWYSCTHYYVAWPHNPDTRETYQVGYVYLVQ